MKNNSNASAIIYGVTCAESLSLPASYYRVASLAPKRTVRMQTLEKFRTEHFQTNLPTPYTHAQPPHLLNPEPSVMTEWFAFSLLGFLAPTTAREYWAPLIEQESTIRTRGGTKIALQNLAQGIIPPHSGHDNPHYFDDLAMVRSIGAALVPNVSKSDLIALVTSDSEITHSEDGIWCAQATASLLWDIINGFEVKQAISRALDYLPSDSWSRQRADEALRVVKNSDSMLTRIMALENEFADRIYAYGIAAPDTFGLLIAHLSSSTSASELIGCSYMHRRNLEALPALMGAFTGALHGDSWLPSGYIGSDLRLKGVSIPSLAGTLISDLAARVN